MLFACPRQNINHRSENLKVIYLNCSVFYAIINYQFKRSEPEKCREVGEANVHFCTICEIVFLVGGPWKSDVVLEKSLKNGCNLLYEPWTDWIIYGWLSDWLTDSAVQGLTNLLNDLWLVDWLTDWLTWFTGKCIDALKYYMTDCVVWGLRSWLNDAALTLELIRLTGQCITSPWK